MNSMKIELEKFFFQILHKNMSQYEMSVIYHKEAYSNHDICEIKRIYNKLKRLQQIKHDQM